MKIIKKLKVKNSLGLHVRPAAVIVKILQNVDSKVEFTYQNETVNAKSIMSILMLAAKKNSRILVTAEGKDAKEVVAKLAIAFDEQFGET
ncbi:MAG TPA: HPr family phosphocarrier protein [Chlamydiales bacterium]|nr:HPr family phosphocarrier protein [Chlamydiales bacterium]